MSRSKTANEENTPPKLTFSSLDYEKGLISYFWILYFCLVLDSKGYLQGCPRDLFSSVELIKIAQHICTADSPAGALSKERLSRES